MTKLQESCIHKVKFPCSNCDGWGYEWTGWRRDLSEKPCYVCKGSGTEEKIVRK